MDVGGGGECRNEIKRDKHAVHCDVKIVIFMKITGSKPISIPFDSIWFTSFTSLNCFQTQPFPSQNDLARIMDG